MTWVLGVLIALFVLDSLRMRGRLSALARIDTDATDGGDDFSLVAADGVELDDASRDAAVAHARKNQLQVLDLVPERTSTTRALAIAQLVDIGTYRDDRLADGRTAGHAIVVNDDTAARAEVVAADRAGDPVSMARLASRLKRYACTASDLAVLPGAREVAEDADKRKAIMNEVIGRGTPFVLGAQLIVLAVLALGVALPETRTVGLIALAAFHVQPALAILGTPLKCRDLPLITLLRWPWELVGWFRTATGRWKPADESDPVAERRPVYADLLDGDLDRFFEPRRETCPVCDAANLSVHLRTRDLLQHKPGRFTLERCGDCAHIFQNPRLSIEGLDFYYKDFYDGLGEKGMDFIFGYSPVSYLGRARMLEGVAEPERWLDVGGGHGHFCSVAREVWPETSFDGLDLSEGIGEASRRGWVDDAYCGLFPDLAGDMRERYDVVSMHHYLEHTRDPRAELAAARTALAPGGHLLIELPDPKSFLGRVLGRYWIPWFQPQHQHLLSTENLERLLKDNGFTAVAWQRGQPHQRVDFMFAVFLFLDRIAPPSDLPWRKPTSLPGRAWRTAVWTLGAPFVLMAHLMDRVLDPIVRRTGMSNTFRVLARRG